MSRKAVYVVVMLGLLLSGCAGSVKNMRAISDDMAVTKPAKGKALVIFMRPSTIGFAIQSSVFAMNGEKAELAGIVAAKKKLSYQVEPGERLFMVVGESGDFLAADLLPDKTYYALVTPRIGVWKARFSLLPVHGDKLGSAEFNGWYNECQWVEKTAESERWAQDNGKSIHAKYSEYYPKWIKNDSPDRQKLLPQDGTPRT